MKYFFTWKRFVGNMLIAPWGFPFLETEQFPIGKDLLASQSLPFGENLAFSEQMAELEE